MLKQFSIFCLLVYLASDCCVAARAEEDQGTLPIVPEGFVVDVIAAEPHVRNPCVLTFDRRGRIFIGQGPQWRSPTPNSPGDHIDILIDEDGDGKTDRVKRYAEGFNCIQGLVWKGRDLWVANAPDLTIVRDLDGDDEADEYVRVYTGLGNLEHALHGLNFGPDGKLYMSKGNSKGLNTLEQLAPKTFRKLWGIPSPQGAPDYTAIETFKKSEYRKKYHPPTDDWGQQGGILRCDSNGRNLEIVSSGFRNPWDITFDDGFDWIGTDNDQAQGDKIFSPFYGAHFGWGHSWSYHWTGEGHLPTVPASAPLFEGSGAGVIHYHAGHFPQEYQNVFFINDWMRREVYLLRPEWQGALLKSRDGFPGVFAHAGGGRSIAGSSGRVFDPTDIEVGPDGALYILSWGQSYGATIRNGTQTDAGRVYRIRHKTSPLLSWKSGLRSKPLAEWSLDELFNDLGSHVPVWRTDAQEEFVRRKGKAKPFLIEKLDESNLTKAEQTWTLWTLGRLGPKDNSIETRLAAIACNENAPENARIQCLRILAFRIREFGKERHLPDDLRKLLLSSNPRIRHATVQAIWQARQKQWTPLLLDLAAHETDRVTFYSTWNALRELGTLEDRKSWLNDQRAGVRLAALLGLFEDDAISAEEVLKFRSDADSRISTLSESWLKKTGGAEPIVRMNPPPGDYTEPVLVTLETSIPNGIMTYTLDGSAPVKTSTRYTGPVAITENTVLKISVMQDSLQAGPITSGKYEIRRVKPYRHRAFISDVKVKSRHEYRMDWTGLNAGKRHYTDRDYKITKVPPELNGMPFLQTATNDDRSDGNVWLSVNSTEDVTVYLGVDVRCNAPLEWMKVSQPDGFIDTGLQVETTDPTFQIYKKDYPAGQITFGGNTNLPTDSGRGNYIILFENPILSSTFSSQPVTIAEVLDAMKSADSERGRELFLHPHGPGCFKCHQMEGRGNVLAPDLSDIGSRAKTPQVLIESIIKPSAVITEGFAQQQVVTTDGKVFSGAVLEETGRSLKLVSSEGKLTTILKAEIEERIGTKISPMPAGFGKMMTAQQVADLTAWLMAQTVVGDRKGFSFSDKRDQLEISFGKQRIATYLKKSSKLTRPALVNVTSPDGIQVTRNFPSEDTKDNDHQLMHPGIWLSFGDLNGNDYWRLRAKTVFDDFVSLPSGNKDSGSFGVRSLYLSEDESQVVCSEITQYKFHRVPEGIMILISSTFKSEDHAFYFGDQEESGLGIRVATPIRVQGGNGSIINDRGEINSATLWGKEAKWFDYFGTIEGRQVGLMVIPDSENPRPSWLHARDYGVVVTNPFPRQPRERRKPYVKAWVKKGEPYRLSYIVLIHDLPVNKPLDREAVYREAVRYMK